MKKIMISMVALMSTIASMAQVITFERTEHDFGKINEADGRVTTVFQFKNEGMAPLVLSNVRASCGCTTPKWPREPIEPGQAGEITVTYNPNGRPGRFQKTITVTSNATENSIAKLYIKGEVIPKPAKPVNQYTVQMGELSLKANSLNFGNIKKGEVANREIEYANHTDHEINVDIATRAQDFALISQVSLQNVKPQETGKFIFAIETKENNLYGPVEFSAYAVINGKKVLNDEYKLTISANIVEDFSAMTVAERQNAPIAEVANTLDLGKQAAGKRVKKSLYIQNAGATALSIRRIYCADSKVEIVTPKGAVKSGKKAEIKFAITTAEAGDYSREVLVITNDPQNPVQKVNLTWTVE